MKRTPRVQMYLANSLYVASQTLWDQIEVLAATFSAYRAPAANTLTPSLTRPASCQPRAGPSGGVQFPDNL
ncbi:MAG TPA: hypothetical protein VF524_04680 [Polyangia bacterium]